MKIPELAAALVVPRIDPVAPTAELNVAAPGMMPPATPITDPAAPAA
jgi:hypothetical protein